MTPSAIVQVTHSGATFAHLADTFVRGVRQRMYVPDQADDDVEAEFVALRTSVDARYSEFCELFASALIGQLGETQPEALLSGLNTELAQRYLEAAGKITRELEQSVPRLTEKLLTAAHTALASNESPALGSGHARALRLAQRTGICDALNRLAGALTRQALLSRGQDAADPQLLASPEARRVRGSLLALLLGFYARLFIKHVGEQHAAAVVEELEREPMRSYLRARSAMQPTLDSRLKELIVSLTREVL